MPSVTLSRPQYDALISAALAGNSAEVKRLRTIIDQANGITRYSLWIRWQDIGGRPPPRIELGKGWPENQTYFLELERKITRADVNDVLRTSARNPVSVMVTPDPLATVGWSLVDDYDFANGG
jgi:hypothetical protein